MMMNMMMGIDLMKLYKYSINNYDDDNDAQIFNEWMNKWMEKKLNKSKRKFPPGL